MHSFDHDITLTSRSETEFQVTIADSWKINVGPNGGDIAAILLKAMKQVIAFAIGTFADDLEAPALQKTSFNDVQMPNQRIFRRARE